MRYDDWLMQGWEDDIEEDSNDEENDNNDDCYENEALSMSMNANERMFNY